ncbi:MAG TPA: hypothetical protein VGQ36_17470 [Thermoanaerobaculia bacterium]|jgi:hypothetical protein|nr:hypothetical protein [Thermoanaerobaculia bacterium]
MRMVMMVDGDRNGCNEIADAGDRFEPALEIILRPEIVMVEESDVLPSGAADPALLGVD